NLPNVTCTAAQICRPAMVAGVANVSACAIDLNYADAQTFCGTVTTGATLVWFNSAMEWSAFSAGVSDGTLFSDAWLGYSDTATEGTWVAAGGTSTYDPTGGTDFWAPNEPNGGVDENAAMIYPSGLVNDGDATDQHPFFCRAP
ncbi:MAG: C-type lectin domain-containing protein, partial [Archangium sp.]